MLTFSSLEFEEPASRSCGSRHTASVLPRWSVLPAHNTITASPVPSFWGDLAWRRGSWVHRTVRADTYRQALPLPKDPSSKRRPLFYSMWTSYLGSDLAVYFIQIAMDIKYVSQREREELSRVCSSQHHKCPWYDPQRASLFHVKQVEE